MAANHHQEPGQPDRHAEALAGAIVALRAILQPDFRDPVDLDEVVQNACGSSYRGFVSLGMSDSCGFVSRPFLGLSYQCLNCFEL
jgi:hypothetical protein